MGLSIAVVTPSLNQGRFIERTIRSVLDQGYSPLEYVVCDGGSTDETPDVLARFGDRLTAVIEPDAGQAAAVNKGIRMTSSEVVGWLNSDDVYCPRSLALVAEFFATHPEADVVYGDAHFLDTDDGVLGAYYTEPWNPLRLTERCFVCQPATFFRRRVVERFGFLNERLGRVPDAWLLNHAHTLVELERASRRRHVVPYALDVILKSLTLSWHWNRSIPPALVARALRPVAKGAGRRLCQSRSVVMSRPAS